MIGCLQTWNISLLAKGLRLNSNPSLNPAFLRALVKETSIIMLRPHFEWKLNLNEGKKAMNGRKEGRKEGREGWEGWEGWEEGGMGGGREGGTLTYSGIADSGF